MKTHRIITSIACAAALLALGAGCATAQPSSGHALPSWNDGPAKQAIVEFVTKTTKPGSPDFVPPAERIATFERIEGRFGLQAKLSTLLAGLSGLSMLWLTGGWGL